METPLAEQIYCELVEVVKVYHRLKSEIEKAEASISHVSRRISLLRQLLKLEGEDAEALDLQVSL